MKRLRDEADPRVAALLDAARTPIDPARKQRVRARLFATRRHRAGLFKPVVVGLLLVGGAAMASQLAVKIYERVLQPQPRPMIISDTSAKSAASATSPSAPATRFAFTPPVPVSEKPKPAERVGAGPTEEESALMMAAMQALRREHDPVRAGALLDDYLRRFEHGALEEEALALAIEAAAARDDARAADLAERYLARHPHGRFTDVAERARERFAK